jgi:tripartite-type tricarboxylate transporter receptor subunit TctC
VVIDNRPGGGGNIGTDAVAKAPPDGYTLLSAGPGSLIMNPGADEGALRHRAGFRPGQPDGARAERAGGASVGAREERQGADRASRVPSPAGSTTPRAVRAAAPTLRLRLFASMAHIDITHVPLPRHRSGVNDLVAGQVQLAVFGIPPVLPHIKQGRLRALGVTGKTRSPELPDVPTVDEAGVPATW